MMKIFKLFLLISTLLILSCKTKYNFKNINIGDAKTFQVNHFKNDAKLIEPGLDRNFRLSLENLIQNQTGLNIVTTNGDLIYEGEIIEYKISPTSITAQDNAANNRLKISINIRFFNTLNKKNNLEQIFSFYYDYPSNKQLTGRFKNDIIKEISQNLTQNIVSTTLGNW